MTEKIIEFYHPGKEHITNYVKKHNWDKEEALKTSIMPSNSGPRRRKFILNKGSYLDKNLNLSKGHMLFWGEWENPSKFLTIDYKNDELDSLTPYNKNKYFDKEGLPQYIHYQLLNEENDVKREVTDPYVFGERFYYSYLKQTSYNILQDLDKGSIILFGCKINNEFLLDTVFVIKDSYKYKRHETNKLYEYVKVSNSFKSCVLDVIKKENEDYHGYHVNYSFYSGLNYNDFILGESDMFSFFPCKSIHISNSISEEVGSKVFRRPVLDLKKYCLSSTVRGINSKVLKNYKGKYSIKISDKETVKSYWSMLVEDILSQGYELGVYAKEPEKK